MTAPPRGLRRVVVAGDWPARARPASYSGSRASGRLTWGANPVLEVADAPHIFRDISRSLPAHLHPRLPVIWVAAGGTRRAALRRQWALPSGALVAVPASV